MPRDVYCNVDPDYDSLDALPCMATSEAEAGKLCIDTQTSVVSLPVAPKRTVHRREPDISHAYALLQACLSVKMLITHPYMTDAWIHAARLKTL